jgi:hypothetical protein
MISKRFRAVDNNTTHALDFAASCERCKYSWTANGLPKACPACGSMYWQLPTLEYKEITHKKRSDSAKLASKKHWVKSRLSLVDELRYWKARALEAESKLLSLF